MITKILMKNVASYRTEAILETSKKTNLIYGLNGTGKSTFSNYLYNPGEQSFQDCRIEGLTNGDKLLVYNTKFIRDNFYETEDIKGIFTLSKGNKVVKKLIDEASEKLVELDGQLNANEREQRSVGEEFDALYKKLQAIVWQIKKDYAGGDRVLEYCLSGLMSKAQALFMHVAGIPYPTQPIDYTIEDIKREVTLLQGETPIQPKVGEVQIDLSDIETNAIMEKIIVGNKNSSVSALIDELKNSAWVGEGIKYVRPESDVCPFCQQHTLST